MPTTIHQVLERFKPAASRRVHVFLAALMWTAVGAALLVAGSSWCLASGGSRGVTFALVGAALGTVKGRLVLARTARRAVARISARPDGSCLGGFIPWSSWALVLVMMLFGVTLRALPIPRLWLGAVYVAIGFALLSGALTFWRALPRI